MTRQPQRSSTARNWLNQFMKFGAIGVLNTALFYLLYLIFLPVLEPTGGYYLAYVLSMIFAVLMNLKFTFRTSATSRKFVLLIGVYFFSMYIGGLVLEMLIKMTITPQLAGLLTIGVTLVTNFVGMKAAARWG